MRHSSVLFLLMLIATGCGNADPKGAAEPQPDGGTDAGPSEQLCPSPDHPRVHYVSEDANECTGVVLECTTEQNGFQNQCGCGCIDKGDQLCIPPTDQEITWIGTDPLFCEPTPPDCPPDQTGFSNSCGCGCVAHSQ